MNEDIGDELLRKVLQDEADIDEALENFHMTGRALGALHQGIVREGASPDDATTITIEWMECHLFDRIERGGYSIHDYDEDADEETSA